MPFTEDLDLFIDTDDFATTVTVDSGSVNAIFEEQWVEINTSRTPFSGMAPTLFGKHSDFTGHNGDAVVIGSTTYTIRDIQPDGSGMCLVILETA